MHTEQREEDIQIKHGRWRLTFEAQTQVHLPRYPGSTWRGALGHALLDQACLTGLKDCQNCTVRDDCDYASLFEPCIHPSPGQSATDRFRDTPRPYVIHVPWNRSRELPVGAGYTFEFSLFGNALERHLDVIQAFSVAAMQGIGSGKGQFKLQRVQRLPAPQMPAPPHQDICVELQTPLRLKSKGHLVTPENLSLEPIVHSLMRRLPWLLPSLLYDKEAVLHEGRNSQIQRQRLHWKDWERYSNRQSGYQKHGGILGQFKLPAPALHLPKLWPLLWWGQYIHVGKSAVMGLGAYRIHKSQPS